MMPSSGTALLHVENLHVVFSDKAETIVAASGVSFEIHPGEIVSLVGESGCGKTATATAILRLIPHPPGKIVGGRVLFRGVDLLQLDDAAMRSIRGRSIAMIFQDPVAALNPVFTIGYQIAGAIRQHEHMSRAAARKRAIQLLEEVRIPDAALQFNAYPHELSGGMQQRVMIAIALAGHPQLLIADEPTSALDVTVQAQILDLLRDIRGKFGMSLLLITHDFGVVNELSDRVFVMYRGRFVEEGSRTEILVTPRHPYTQSLIAAMPRRSHGKEQLAEMEEPVPIPRLTGCLFAPRCSKAMDICQQVSPKPIRLSVEHQAWCHAVAEEEAR